MFESGQEGRRYVGHKGGLHKVQVPLSWVCSPFRGSLNFQYEGPLRVHLAGFDCDVRLAYEECELICVIRCSKFQSWYASKVRVDVDDVNLVFGTRNEGKSCRAVRQQRLSGMIQDICSWIQHVDPRYKVEFVHRWCGLSRDVGFHVERTHGKYCSA